MEGQNLIKQISNVLKDISPFSSKAVLGIDIGASSVKISLVKKLKQDSFKLVAFSSTPVAEGVLIEDEIQEEAELIDVIKQGLKDLKTTAHRASIGMFGPSTVVRKFPLGAVDENELDEQVNWEAEQYIPFPIEETALSYHIIGENEGGGLDVLLVASKFDVLDNFKSLVEKVGLNLKIADLNYVALANSFMSAYGDDLEEGRSYLFVDLGAQYINVFIIRDGNIVFTKDINLGGITITEEIQRQLGLNYYEAEELKIIGDAQGNLPEEVLEIINAVSGQMVSEIKKSLDFYLTSSADDTLSSCYITGGTSLLHGLAEKFESVLGLSVEFFNPFNLIGVDSKKISEELTQEALYKGAISIGLSLRGAEGR